MVKSVSGRLAASIAVWPVSYTHLDVYKRQLYTLADGILVRTRERSEHQVARIGVAGMHRHARTFFIDFADLRDIRKVEPRIDVYKRQVQYRSLDRKYWMAELN